MKDLYKKISIGLVLTFIVMLFQPISNYAREGLSPSLSINSEGKYTISSVEDLNKLRSDIDKGIDYSGKEIILTQDVNISKSQEKLNSFSSENKFNGTFNGKFHIISGYIDVKSGLFSFIDKDGVVKNVRVSANIEINNESKIIGLYGSGIYGLIANENEGKITRCSTTGILKINVTCEASGIVGDNELKNLTDCYSNIIFDNQVEKDTPRLAGICRESGMDIEHCYFYGKFIGNELDDVLPVGRKAKTSAYNGDALGMDISGSSKEKKFTTEEMKNKDTYTTLGFDFDKYWSIDPNINNGYPYLDPQKEEKIVDIPLDIQVTVEDKTWNSNLSLEENLKAKITDIRLIQRLDENADLINKYDVKVSYNGDAKFCAPTLSNTPIDVNLDRDIEKFNITYKLNDEYKFVADKVLLVQARLLDNGQPGPTEARKKELIENAKKAEDILYNKLEIGHGNVPEFRFLGGKRSNPESEGDVVLDDYVWEVFSSARSEYKGIRAGFYDEWFKNVQDGLKKMKEAGIEPLDVKMTEWDKLVLAITAIGYDPRDIEAYDLIDIVSNEDYLSKSAQMFSRVYALYALDSYKFPIPKDGKRINLEEMIHNEAESASKGIGADGSKSRDNTAPDMWSMSVQPMASYYDPNAKKGDKYYDVKVAMDYVFDKFSRSQTYKGSFWGGFGSDYNNPWTNAQVYMNLGMARADIFDKKYIKDGKTILDGVLERFDIEKGTTMIDNSWYEPPQICRGLDSIIRASEGRNSIFDCTDVKDSTVPVNDVILNLPENITSANKAEVDAAQALYDALGDIKKASIKETTKAKLAAAQAKIKAGDEKPIIKTLKIENITDKTEFVKGEKAKITVKATNNGTEAKDVTLIVTLFDKNGQMINYSSPNVSIKVGDNKELEASFKLPNEDGYKVKAFIWDSLEGMIPLSDVIEITVK